MPTISGHVYYTAGNNNTPGTGIQNVPVALFDSVGLVGATALTDATGAFSFSNVPNGTYQVIEAWGAAGGIPTPVNYAASVGPMPVPPAEAEPPLSALSVVPPAAADFLQARSPNLLFVNVAGSDITGLTFYDSPVGEQPLVFNGVNVVGPNLITAAANGTWGTNPAGTAANTIPPVEPYPGVTPGFIYTPNLVPIDGFYHVANTTNAGVVWNGIWFGTSDHTTRLETGRYITVNGANPGAAIFTQPVAVTPNTNYALSAWIMNLITNQVAHTNPKLGIRVLDQNGNVLVAQDVNPIPVQPIPVWFENGFLFNSAGNSNLTVQIISQGPLSQGNDYLIDDVTMYEAQFVDLLDFSKDIQPPIVYSETGVGESATVTINVTNTSTQTINNVLLKDVLDAYLLFTPGSVLVDGSNVGFETADPNVGFSLGNMVAGETHIITFAISTTGGPATVQNTAEISYDAIVSGTGDVIRATFPSNIANFEIQVNSAIVAINKSVDKLFAEVGDVLTYTLTLQNSGNMPANNVVLTDAIPTGTTFINGTLFGATGTPPTLNVPSIPAGGSSIVTYQVLVGNTIPTPNPVPNSASAVFTFTIDPNVPNGGSGTAQSNMVSTQVNSAIITTSKAVDKAFADVGDTITYTITVANSGNVPANNVVLTDAIPAGTTYVAGSLTGATGTPPTLTLLAPVPAGGAAVVTYQVLVGAVVPNPNPVKNSASAAFTYTVDPDVPNGASAVSYSNVVGTQVNTAKLVVTKSVDKPLAYIGDILTYQIVVKNTGNVSANNVVLIDLLPVGVSYVAGSLIVSVPYSGTLALGLALTNPIAAGQTVTISFKVKVDAMPNPNPIANLAHVIYAYTVDPSNPNGVIATSSSNTAHTVIFRYNFGQQISDLIDSVALEQAALAAIANAEGAKIQKMVSLGGVTTHELLCLNKSVSDMMDSIAMLEAVLKQKLNIVSCQISGGCQ